MSIVLPCPVKINLTLRILAKRADGYHDLYSLLWKKYSKERLTISPKYAEIIGDSLEVRGLEIKGENLVTKALAAARRSGADIPALAMELDKKYPAGSGIGAGSGNAAALLSWLADTFSVSLSPQETGRLGADVVFLAQKYEMAEASGIGERLSPFLQIPRMSWLLVFPSWASDTKEAYAALDEMRQNGYTPLTRAQAANEAGNCAALLCKGERTGLLPNDFYPLLAEKHHEYGTAEEIAEESGALGWGLCGSGSAFFVLCSAHGVALRAAAERFTRENWVIKTDSLE